MQRDLLIIIDEEVERLRPAKLSAGQADVAAQRLGDFCSRKEIAARLEISPRAVTQRLRKAAKKLGR